MARFDRAILGRCSPADASLKRQLGLEFTRDYDLGERWPGVMRMRATHDGWAMTKMQIKRTNVTPDLIRGPLAVCQISSARNVQWMPGRARHDDFHTDVLSFIYIR
jgi:hypothetical protein